MIAFACAACGKELRAREDLAGEQVRCPKCGHIAPIPAPVAAHQGGTLAEAAPPAPAREDCTLPTELRAPTGGVAAAADPVIQFRQYAARLYLH